jgi:NADH-quinone oxidoreductase subunit N
MIVVSTVSIVFGSFAGVKQKKIKTLLAYSSVSHMGYSLLTVSNFMILGLEMLYFYLLIYILSSTVVWCLIIGLKNNAGDYKAKATKNISDLVLLSKSNWFLAFGFSLSCLSLAGIPPLIGFIAKLNVFLILVVQNFQLLAFFVILCSAVSTFFYIRLIKVLYFEPSTIGRLYSFKFNYVLLFCSCIFCLIFLFVNPKLLYLEIHKMVLFENYNKFGFIFEDVSNFLLIFNLILAK